MGVMQGTPLQQCMMYSDSDYRLLATWHLVDTGRLVQASYRGQLGLDASSNRKGVCQLHGRH